MSESAISELDQASFQSRGFLVKRNMVSPETCDAMCAVADEQVGLHLAPIEYEFDVQYPGSPSSLEAEGGRTIRRLLHAFTRHELFRQWATCREVATLLRALFEDHQEILLSQSHHNCLMTKHPGFSSATLWHQDNRYWSFDKQNLISTWLALGDETRENGCLRVISGSHKLELDPGRFDAALFLRPDLKENKSLLAGAERVELQKGDVLFFHSRLFHAAGRNLSSEVKYSLVFTYHQEKNQPIQDTRSARFPGIPLGFGQQGH